MKSCRLTGSFSRFVWPRTKGKYRWNWYKHRPFQMCPHCLSLIIRIQIITKRNCIWKVFFPKWLQYKEQQFSCTICILILLSFTSNWIAKESPSIENHCSRMLNIILIKWLDKPWSFPFHTPTSLHRIWWHYQIYFSSKFTIGMHFNSSIFYK